MVSVKSNDPRKPAIVAALKRISGCTKVTSVKENVVEGIFSGTCMWPEPAHTRQVKRFDVGGVVRYGGVVDGLA